MDGEGGALDTRLVALGGFVHLDAEPAGLRPAKIHAEQHLSPVLALRPSSARMDADDGVAGVELPGEQALLLQLLEDPTDFSGQPLDLLPQFFGHLVVHRLFTGHVEESFQVAELSGETVVVLKTTPQTAVAGAHLLGVNLVVPEFGGTHRLLKNGDLVLQRIGVKDSPLPT